MKETTQLPCYVDDSGRPYGIGLESPSSPPTHIITFSVEEITPQTCLEVLNEN